MFFYAKLSLIIIKYYLLSRALSNGKMLCSAINYSHFGAFWANISISAFSCLHLNRFTVTSVSIATSDSSVKTVVSGSAETVTGDWPWADNSV